MTTDDLMNLDLKALSTDALQTIHDLVGNEIQLRAAQQREEAKRKIRELADAHELDLKDVLGKSTPTKPDSKAAAALMRNPDNFMETWNGVGRKPEWYKRAIAAGKHPSELRIPDNS